MSTMGEIRDEVIMASGRSDLSTTIATKINQLITQFVIEFNFPLQKEISTRATVVGQDRYAPPIDMVDWVTMEIIDPDAVTVTELIYRNRTEMELYYGIGLVSADRGYPQYVTFDREEFVIKPVPDLTTYTLRLPYFKSHTTLGVGDTNYFTINFPLLIQVGVLRHLYFNMGNEGRYKFWNSIYKEEFEKMKFALRKKQLKSVITLPIRMGPLAGTNKSSLHVGFPFWGKM